jgi:hypothetical protein
MKILFGSVPAEECSHGPMSMPPIPADEPLALLLNAYTRSTRSGS